MYWRRVWPRVNRAMRRHGVICRSLSGCLAAQSRPVPAMMNLTPAKSQMEKMVISNPWFFQ